MKITDTDNFPTSEPMGDLYGKTIEITKPEDLEYVFGTSIPAYYTQFYKFIQNPSTVGVPTYKRMIDTDDTIGSGIELLTTCLAARIGDYTHPSEEIQCFVRECICKIQGGFENVLKNLLSATWAGFSVCELVWHNEDGVFFPKRFIPLPPSTILFEVDYTGSMEHSGVLQYQRVANPMNMSSSSGCSGFSGQGAYYPDPAAKFGDALFPHRMATTLNYLTVKIPKDKCIIYSFNAQGQFDNPYGRSLLRKIHKWYVNKDAYIQMMGTALDRKGTPLTIVYADNSRAIMRTENVIGGTNNRDKTGKSIRADVAASEKFTNIHNDSVIILPGKKGEVYEVDFVPQSSNSSDFIAAIDLCNKSILRGLLIPALMFNSGDGSGSYSLGQEHSRTFDKIIDGINSGLKEALIEQYIKPLLLYNFDESDFKKDGYGKFSKQSLTEDERKSEMEVIEKAVNIGAIDVNDLHDLNKIRDTVGFDRVTEVIKIDNENENENEELEKDAE